MSWSDDPPKECHECGRTDTIEKKGNGWICTSCGKRVKKK